jgi:hypothetical protein
MFSWIDHVMRRCGTEHGAGRRSARSPHGSSLPPQTWGRKTARLSKSTLPGCASSLCAPTNPESRPAHAHRSDATQTHIYRCLATPLKSSPLHACTSQQGAEGGNEVWLFDKPPATGGPPSDLSKPRPRACLTARARRLGPFQRPVNERTSPRGPPHRRAVARQLEPRAAAAPQLDVPWAGAPAQGRRQVSSQTAGTRHQAQPDSWHQAPGTRHSLATGTKHQARSDS